MARNQYIIGLLMLQSCLSSANEVLKRCSVNSRRDSQITPPQEISCVSLPQNTPERCQEKRQQDLQKERKIYTLTKPSVHGKISAKDNLPKSDLKYSLSCPLLDLSIPEVLYLTNTDPNQQQWLGLFGYINKRNDNFTKSYFRNPRKLTQIDDFIDIYEKAKAFQVSNPALEKFFQYPSSEEPFKDIINTGDWEDDNVFTEQRLGGLNVHSIQKVTSFKGWWAGGMSWSDLKRKLNTRDFDWNEAFQKAFGSKVNMKMLILSGSVFVVSFPIMKGLTNVPDITGDPRVMRKSTSPIAVFVSTKDGGRTNKLKPVAIQIYETRDSPVYAPSDGSQWLMAKSVFQQADFAYLEMVEHLLKAHFLFESICVTLRRNLAHDHPLMQIMKHHCIGVFVTNSVGVPKLLGEKGSMHTMFPIGNVGAIELVNRAYAGLSWFNMDFNVDLKKRGLLNKRKLPYYPYRDDGEEILKILSDFTKDYVDAYYHINRDVWKDKELQNFANELSRDGRGENGGIGMLKGFPSRIGNKRVLKKTLTQILWIVIRHHTVNYPVDYYGSFVPNMPSKLYDARGVYDDAFSLKRLPPSPYVAFQVALGFSLASLRYDNLFDHSKKMEDALGQCIVQGYYDIIMSDIKVIIEERNRRRKKAGHLTYPYLQPGWIPNSIHT